MEENIHAGHRNRLKKRFLDQGFENMQDHEILELLLFYAIPRKDTNELAHKLIDHFGSLTAVFDASISNLMEVNGVAESTATLITMIPKLASVYQYGKCNTAEPVDIDSVCEMLVSKYIGIYDETVYLTLLDIKCKLLFVGIINKGNVNCAQIYIRKIITLATQYNASYAIVSHNHPSGFAIPSADDIKTTIKVRDALNTINVKLIDHIIIADGEAISIAQSDIYPDLFK